MAPEYKIESGNTGASTCNNTLVWAKILNLMNLLPPRKGGECGESDLSYLSLDLKPTKVH